jgi:hypothetical protein
LSDRDLLERYNYDSFVPEKFQRWDRFGEGPPLESAAPDFPLLTLDGAGSRLSRAWSAHALTVVEFGSFT